MNGDDKIRIHLTVTRRTLAALACSHTSRDVNAWLEQCADEMERVGHELANRWTEWEWELVRVSFESRKNVVLNAGSNMPRCLADVILLAAMDVENEDLVARVGGGDAVDKLIMDVRRLDWLQMIALVAALGFAAGIARCGPLPPWWYSPSRRIAADLEAQEKRGESKQDGNGTV